MMTRLSRSVYTVRLQHKDSHTAIYTKCLMWVHLNAM